MTIYLHRQDVSRHVFYNMQQIARILDTQANKVCYFWSNFYFRTRFLINAHKNAFTIFFFNPFVPLTASDQALHCSHTGVSIITEKETKHPFSCEFKETKEHLLTLRKQ